MEICDTLLGGDIKLSRKSIKKKEIKVASEMKTDIMNQKNTLEAEDTLYSVERKQDFEKIVKKKHQRVSLPIKNIEKLESEYIINVKWTNEIIFHRKKERPKYIGLDGKYETAGDFYGLYDEEPFSVYIGG